MSPDQCCDSCAFRKPGTGGAASESNNRLEALICAHGGIPFYCHHRQDGTEWDWRAGLIEFSALPPSQRRVCGGWKAMVRNLFASGWRKRLNDEFPEDRRALISYQRGLAQQSLKALRTFLTTKGKRAKALAKQELRESLLATFSK